MSKLLTIVLSVGIALSPLSAGTLRFELEELGVNGSGDPLFRYTYDWTGDPFEAGMELEVGFNPATYESLSNPQAVDSGFDLLLLQPDNPPGVQGVFSLLAEMDGVSLNDPFSVDFVGVAGVAPGSQPYNLNRFDPETMEFIETLESGASATVVPEPATVWLAGLSMLLLGVGRAFRRQRLGR